MSRPRADRRGAAARAERCACLLFLLLLFPRPAAAQSPEALFDSAAARHAIELEDLYRQRGAPMPPLKGVADHGSVAATLGERYPPGTALVLYAFDDPGEALRVWLLDAEGVRAFTAVPLQPALLDSAIADVRAALGVVAQQEARAPTPPPGSRGFGAGAAGDPPPVDEAVERLGGMLFPRPIGRALEQTRHLIVVPTRGIGMAPLAVLRPLRGGGMLIDGMSISVAPSLYDIDPPAPNWWYTGMLNSGRALRILAVADPAVRELRGWTFPGLPGARREVAAVTAGHDARVLAGPGATERAVLREVSRSFFSSWDILYFATHGVADPEDPVDGSFLALGASGSFDGALTAREIQELGLALATAGSRGRCCALVVLSACQTGVGLAHEAGVIGLARGFHKAGVPRVMMTLWNVDDQATAGIMTDFMGRIHWESPAAALRAAMLAARDRGEPPAHWAPFVLFGHAL